MLLTDPLQMWDIDFTGTFSGQVTLTFGYGDANLLLGMVEEDLRIFHRLDGGGWEMLSVVAIDTENNTISVTTDSFSTFALGGVPEPATLIVLCGAVPALLARRRRRR